MESKKINQLATELAPELSDLTIIGDPTTGISKKITLSQMASLFTGTVEEYASLSAFPLVGTADTIYIALDTNILYRWNTGTSAYVELSPNVVSSLVFNDANGFDGTISLVGSVATLTITTALTQGSVPFIGASGALTQDNTNFFWDNSNKRLGINTNTPTGALDVFGSGIIGRLNGTSTNNSFLGFASAGSNKWSIGNVQSDHRFRIYNEAATSELFTVLPTGEIGIGIANPLTKLHIDGGASALIANLDANVSVAKSVSFRSDNSSRFNIEVSGTESGSNAGMDFYLRAYTDAGALLSTPLTISRSTGAVTLSSSLSATGATFTNTQTNLILNTTTNTSFTKLSFQENGSEKATITYPNSTFGAPTRREKLEISNLGGINFITQNAPLTPNVTINSSGNVSIGNTNDTYKLDVSGTLRITGASLFSSSVTTSDLVQTNKAGGLVYRAYFGSGNNRPLDINIDGGNGDAQLTWNTTYNGGWKYYLNNYAARIASGNGLYFSVAASGTAGNTISWIDALAITSSGNVGIGTSSPSEILDIRGAFRDTTSGEFNQVIYSTTTQDAGRGGSIGLGGTANGTSSLTTFAGLKGQKENGDGGNTAGTLTFWTRPNAGAMTERMRLSSNGNLLIGLTTDNGFKLDVLGQTVFRSNNALTVSMQRQNGDGQILGFYKDATLVGSISTNSNSLPSDLNFKKNINNLDLGLNLIKKLRSVSYNHKIDDDNAALSTGFIAQELEQSLTELGIEKNKYYILQHQPNEDKTQSEYWLDYAKMIPILVNAIQEQQAQIEELKALINK